MRALAMAATAKAMVQQIRAHGLIHAEICPPAAGVGDQPMWWIPGEDEEANPRGAVDMGSGCAAFEDSNGDGEDSWDDEDDDDREEPWGRGASITDIIAWKRAHYRD